MAILPFFLEVLLHHLIDLRFLRVFRLTRLLKLTRGNDATATLPADGAAPAATAPVAVAPAPQRVSFSADTLFGFGVR